LRPGICSALATIGRLGAAMGGGGADGEPPANGLMGGGAAPEVSGTDRLIRSFGASVGAGAVGAIGEAGAT